MTLHNIMGSLFLFFFCLNSVIVAVRLSGRKRCLHKHLSSGTSCSVHAEHPNLLIPQGFTLFPEDEQRQQQKLVEKIHNAVTTNHMFAVPTMAEISGESAMENVRFLLVEVMVGGQKLRVIPDTGSFSFLVKSAACDNCAKVGAFYDRAKSQHFEAGAGAGHHMRVEFGNGPVWVDFGYDTVGLGKYAAEHQALGEITHASRGFNFLWQTHGGNFDGLMGLGKLSVDPFKGENTLLANMGMQNFAFCLGNKTRALLYWGSIPQPPKPLTWVPVVGERHWALRVVKYGFVYKKESKPKQLSLFAEPTNAEQKEENQNDEEVVMKQCGTAEKGCGAVIDSGTTAIAAPMQMHISFLNDVQKNLSEATDSPCSKLPDLLFEFDNGGKLRVPHSAYAFERESDGKCLLELMESPIGADANYGPAWIFGLPVFKSHLVVYDRGDGKSEFKLGFAPHEDGSACPHPEGKEGETYSEVTMRNI